MGAGGAFWAIRAAYQILRGREGGLGGLGDVKLMAGLGAALGPLDLPLMVLLASLASLAAALTGIVTTGGQRPAATTPPCPSVPRWRRRAGFCGWRAICRSEC